MIRSGQFKALGQPIAAMALPVLIEQFFIVIMGIVNTMLAANLGREAISAVGMVDAINMIAVSLFSALAIGGTVVIAQYTGKNDAKMVNSAASQALASCFIISVLLTLLVYFFRQPLLHMMFSDAEPQVLAMSLTYLSISLWSYLPIALIVMSFGILRGSGDTRTPMIVSILMNFLNVIFSYTLIYGIRIGQLQTPAFGVAGAAWGLTLARLAGAGLIMASLFRGSRGVQIRGPRGFRFEPELQKCIFGLGIPASAEQLMFNGGKLLVQTFIVSLGTVSIAANTLVNSISSLQMIPGMVLAIAAPVLVGREIGAGRPDESRRQLKFMVFAGMILNGLISLIMLPFMRGLLSLYTSDSHTADLAAVVMLINLLVYPVLWPAAFIIPSGIRGAGDVRYTMIISIISMWLLRILSGYIFAIVLQWGLLGVWIGMYADWLGRAMFFILRLLGGKWLKKPVFASKTKC